MSIDPILYVGTAGQGVWRSTDGGQRFARASSGMFMESEVRALAVHPSRPQTLYAGTDAGLYRTDDGGDRWERIDAPFDPGRGWQAGVVIWSLLIHPRDPDALYVGVCPPAIYRSRDAGGSWERLPAAITPECGPIVYSRVTCLLADPDDANVLWAGVEIDGVWRSADGGGSWERRSEGLSSQDIHGLTIVPGSPRRLLASTNNDLNVSIDEGATWQPQNVRERFPNAYCRGVLPKPGDPRTLFLGNGNGPPGSVGSVQVSRDGGQTWTEGRLSSPANSTIWTFAVSAAVPDLVLCASVSGQVYRSADGGATWEKVAHEFGEVRSLALTVR